MGFNYIPVDRVSTISPDDFYSKYVKQQKPVVVERLTADWPAYEKWHFEYIKQVAGDTIVPLYDNGPVDYTKKVNEPDATMKMRDYIDLLLAGKTTMRIFLYSLLKNAPILQNDFKFPNLKLKLVKSLPFLFFGGKNVNVFMHYDIDLSNILHFHFAGEKRCVLVSPEQTPMMYKIPYSNICHESIDIDNPDFEKWPALSLIQPYIADLKHGEMLYIPEAYWHYMKYITPGFSMSLRAFPIHLKNIVSGVLNLFVIRHYDNWMRKRKGAVWLEEKNKRAIDDTNALLAKQKP